MKILYFSKLMIVTLVILLSGCNSNESSRRNEIKTDNTYSSASGNEDDSFQSSPKYEDITDQDVYDFIETWSKVYATHTFDNYIKMYSRNNFIGIKRTFQGERNTYDFIGWVTNKKNEFRKFKPYVEIENIKVKFLNQNGRSKVSFLQKWYSTTSDYADQGEKVLILYKQQGEIYIEKEELLYSEPLVEYGD